MRESRAQLTMLVGRRRRRRFELDSTLAQVFSFVRMSFCTLASEFGLRAAAPAPKCHWARSLLDLARAQVRCGSVTVVAAAAAAHYRRSNALKCFGPRRVAHLSKVLCVRAALDARARDDYDDS